MIAKENRNNYDVVFFLVIGLSIFLLIHLMIYFGQAITNLKDFIKLFGGVLLPFPPAIFASCILAVNQKHIELKQAEFNLQEVKKAVIAFVAFIFLMILFIQSYEFLFHTKFKDNTLLPLLLNSAITLTYAINYSTVFNIVLAGILSGSLLGITIYIVFL